MKIDAIRVLPTLIEVIYVAFNTREMDIGRNCTPGQAISLAEPTRGLDVATKDAIYEIGDISSLRF